MLGQVPGRDRADHRDPLLLLVREALPAVPRLVLAGDEEGRFREGRGGPGIPLDRLGEVVRGQSQRRENRRLPDGCLVHTQLTPDCLQTSSPNAEAVATVMPYFAHTPDSSGTWPARWSWTTNQSAPPLSP